MRDGEECSLPFREKKGHALFKREMKKCVCVCVRERREGERDLTLCVCVVGPGNEADKSNNIKKKNKWKHWLINRVLMLLRNGCKGGKGGKEKDGKKDEGRGKKRQTGGEEGRGDEIKGGAYEGH